MEQSTKSSRRAHLFPGSLARHPAPNTCKPKALIAHQGKSNCNAKRNEEQVACPDWAYNNRNRVERLWGRLKEWRAVATRYEKTACSFMGVLCFAATMDWIRN